MRIECNREKALWSKYGIASGAFWQRRNSGIYGTGYYSENEIGGLQYGRSRKKEKGVSAGEGFGVTASASFSDAARNNTDYTFQYCPSVWPGISIQELPGDGRD
jgi:hypothetical protein